MSSTLIWITLLFLFCNELSVAQVYRSDFGRNADAEMDQLPFIDIKRVTELHTDSPTTDAERIRSERYSAGKGGRPLYDPATGKALVTERNVRYLDRDALPVSSSDVVAIGTIQSSSVHISRDGSMVYSTFAFIATSVLKGRLRGVNGLNTLERIGGVALYPDGKKRFVGESGKGLPEANHEYLLFLKEVDGGSSYQIEAGYSSESDKVKSLDALGDRLSGETRVSLLAQTRAKLNSVK